MTETDNIVRSERRRQYMVVAGILTLMGGTALFHWNQRSWLGEAMANPAAFSVAGPAEAPGGVELAMADGASGPYLRGGRRGPRLPGATDGSGSGGPIEESGLVGNPAGTAAPGAGVGADPEAPVPFAVNSGAGGGATNSGPQATAPGFSNTPGGPGVFIIGNGGNGGGGGGGTPIDPDTPLNPTDPQVPPVPEPGTWMMMILGVGMIGTALRRRRAVHGLQPQGQTVSESVARS